MIMIFKKAAPLFLILFSLGCGSEDSAPTPARGSNPAHQGQHESGGKSVFSFPEENQESRQARLDFIQQEKFVCVKNKGTFYGDSFVCDLNTSRGKWNGGMLPKAPVFAPYADAYGIAVNSVQFPISFFHTLPVALQNQVKKDAPNQLEIFWVIQSYAYKRFFPKPKTFQANQVILRERDIEPIHQLKAHFWALPERDFWGKDPNFQKSYQMMIFDPLDELKGQLKSESPTSVEVSVHDGNRISPPGVGEVDFGILQTAGKTSVWSYVYDDTAAQGERRAVATLHWLVSDADLQGVMDLMKDPVLQPLSIQSFSQELTKKRSFVASLPARIYGPSGDKYDFDNQNSDFPMSLDLSRLLPTLEKLLGTD